MYCISVDPKTDSENNKQLYTNIDGYMTACDYLGESNDMSGYHVIFIAEIDRSYYGFNPLYNVESTTDQLYIKQE